MLDTIALAIGLDDVELDALISALATGASVALFLSIVATALIAFHFLDAWRADRNSPVGRLRRRRHFGGV